MHHLTANGAVGVLHGTYVGIAIDELPVAYQADIALFSVFRVPVMVEGIRSTAWAPNLNIIFIQRTRLPL